MGKLQMCIWDIVGNFLEEMECNKCCKSDLKLARIRYHCHGVEVGQANDIERGTRVLVQLLISLEHRIFGLSMLNLQSLVF